MQLVFKGLTLNFGPLGMEPFIGKNGAETSKGSKKNPHMVGFSVVRISVEEVSP